MTSQRQIIEQGLGVLQPVGMQCRLADPTWPDPGIRIWHASRPLIRKMGYSYENSYRGLLHAYNDNCDSIDNDACMTSDGVGVVGHWDLPWRHGEKPMLNGRVWRGRISKTPWRIVRHVTLRGRKIRTMVQHMRHAHQRFKMQVSFELKDQRFARAVGRRYLAKLHAVALRIGAKFQVMAMPEGGRGLERLSQRGPIRGMLLSRGRVTLDQLAEVDAVKGPAKWTRDVDRTQWMVLGAGCYWGRSA